MPGAGYGADSPFTETGDKNYTTDGKSGTSGETGNYDREDMRTLPENSARFTVIVRGEYKVYTFTAVNNFTKITVSPELSGYVANFAENMGKINIRNQSTYSNVISIMLPVDVAPGDYNEKSDNVIFQYFGPDKGIIYNPDQIGSFLITIHEWGGSGGRAKGTFSGKLKADEQTDPVLIQEGIFDIGIQ
jgi:hypothetical protein